MTNVGRRDLFVQFQIKTQFPSIISDDHEQEDGMGDKGRGLRVSDGRVSLLKSTLVCVMYKEERTSE